MAKHYKKQLFKKGDWITTGEDSMTIYEVIKRSDDTGTWFHSGEYHICTCLRTRKSVDIYDMYNPRLVIEDDIINALANNIVVKYKRNKVTLIKNGDYIEDQYATVCYTLSEAYDLYVLLEQCLNLNKR